MTTYVKPKVDENARTLPARYYTDSDIYAAERERIFAASWLCVGREEQFPDPGAYVLAKAAGESIIVLRDSQRQLRAFYNVCRHRGTRMCTEQTGRFKGSIQCPYHAWTYGLDGRLIAARNMESVPGFDRDEFPLHPIATAAWEGFVFINLAKRTDPFDETFAPLIGRFADWEIAALRTARTIEYDLRCNWKLVFMNYSECYHCPLVHPQLDKLSPSDSGRNDLVEGPFLGGYSELRRHGASLTTTGTTARSPIGNVRGENLNRVYYYTIFPSMLLSLHPDYVMVHYVTPLAPDHTRVVCAWLFDPAAAAASGFDPSDAVDFWDVTNRQDWHVNELTQLGVQSRAYVPGPFAHAEGLLRSFDRYYMERMRE